MRFNWAFETTWPKVDPQGFVFLARAFHEVGQAIHPGKWEGDEWQPLPNIFVGPPDPRFVPKAAAAWERYTSQLASLPALPPPPRPGLFGSGALALGSSFTETPLPPAWQDEPEVVEEREAFMRERMTKGGRRLRAMEWIAEAGLSGDIQTFVRIVGGRGDPLPVPGPAVWDGDDPLWPAIFATCAREMQAIGTNELHLCHIFLGRASLTEALSRWLEKRALGQDKPCLPTNRGGVDPKPWRSTLDKLFGERLDEWHKAGCPPEPKWWPTADEWARLIHEASDEEANPNTITDRVRTLKSRAGVPVPRRKSARH